MATEHFIGISNLQTVANKILPQIVMGPAYHNADEMARLGINVISGVQFKHTKYVLHRKGGTTRRKVVGEELNNRVGYLDERPLTAYLSWNHYTDNQDRYVELPFQRAENAAEFSYPMSEIALEAALTTYMDDLFANLFFGNAENGKAGFDLYDGYHTLIAKDILAGNIAYNRKNLVKVEAIDAPTTNTDFTAWRIMEKFYAEWSPALKRAKSVFVYCSSGTGVALANAYSNKYAGNVQVKYLDNGNFKVSEWPKVTFVPSDDFGTGDLLVATIEGNFEYGVDSENKDNHLIVREGSDKDALDVQIQVQTIQGTRILNVDASSFCMTNGKISDTYWSGDYQKNTFTVGVNIEGAGTVTVNNAAPDNEKEYDAKTTLELKAQEAEHYSFVMWSDGSKEKTHTVITTGDPGAIVAIFKKKD